MGKEKSDYSMEEEFKKVDILSHKLSHKLLNILELAWINKAVTLCI